MGRWKRALIVLFRRDRNDDFLNFIDILEDFFAKILAIAMAIVVLFSIIDLVLVLTLELATPPPARFSTTLLKIFGLFLNILIALEITQNITSYLKNHSIQVEMVIVTSLIAVARKIILLDFEKISEFGLLALAVAILFLSICYWIVKRTNARYPH